MRPLAILSQAQAAAEAAAVSCMLTTYRTAFLDNMLHSNHHERHNKFVKGPTRITTFAVPSFRRTLDLAETCRFRPLSPIDAKCAYCCMLLLL